MSLLAFVTAKLCSCPYAVRSTRRNQSVLAPANSVSRAGAYWFSASANCVAFMSDGRRVTDDAEALLLYSNCGF